MSGSGGGSGSGGRPPGGPGSDGRLSDHDPTRRFDSGAVAGSGREGSGSGGGRGGYRPASLAPTDRLSGRFEVVRFLGRGGMGEVYEAQDLDLGARVAVKTLRPEIAADPEALDRFRREIHLARRVTHPNACRLFDLWRHRPEVDGGAAVELTFLTMELLGGETLAERLRRDGAMTTDEALPIVRQIADGLGAAHQAGVVHRDLKSGNVMLMPQPDGGTRAVVTDFGLARAAVGGGPVEATLTQAGKVVGSPSYMSPEQVQAGEIDARTDIYSLGVVLFEMVTGRLPFVADSALATAVKRLSEPPPPPRKLVPGLPARWEAVILRCLAREPDERFASPAEVVAALGGEAVPASPRKRRLRLIVAAAALALLVGLAFGLGRLLRSGPGSGPAAATDRPALAVLSFRNLAGDADAAWLATALPELLSTDLAAGGALRLVPRETVSRAELDLELPAGTLAADTLDRVRAQLGSDYVVVGSYLSPGGNGLRLDVSLQEAAAGETRSAVSQSGLVTEVGDLISQVAEQLRAALGAPAAAEPALRLASWEATRAYAEGLARLRVFDASGARPLLEAAVAADPELPEAHSALADAWKALGYDARAEEAARRAAELAAELPFERRQRFAGRYQAAAGEWPEAVATYTELWSRFPDDPEYGLLLADAQIAAGGAPAVAATIEALRALPPPAGEDPRIDLAAARAAYARSDFPGELAAARQAVAAGEAMGARLLVAQGRLLEGQALEQQGDFDPARDAYRAATRLYAGAGDRVGEARSLHNMAIVFAKQGNLSGARELLEGALATYEEAGSRGNQAQALSNLGSVTRLQGDPPAAERFYEQALAIAEEINDRRGRAREITNLAVVRRDQGDPEGAIARYRQALGIWRELGDRAQLATTLNNLAMVHLDQDRRDQARTLLESSRALFEEVGDRPSAASTVSNLGRIATDEGRLAEAERFHQQALAAYRELGAVTGEGTELYYLATLARRRGEVEEAASGYREAMARWDDAGVVPRSLGSRLALAELFADAGRWSEAATVAAEAAAGYARAGHAPGEAPARALLALAAAAVGRPEEAAREAAVAERLAKDLPPAGRLPVAVLLARAAAAGGEARSAAGRLAALLAEVESVGLTELALDTRLALGEAEVAAGLTGAGRGAARLAAVEAEAREQGYALLARRAAAARG